MPFDTVTLNNATRVLPFFLVLSSDHITGATGKSPLVKISKNGAAGVTPAGAVTEIDAVNLPGWYQIAAHATDANTAGPLLLHASAAACDPADYSFEVLAYNPDDGLRLGLTVFPAVTSGSAGSLPTTGSGANQIALASGAVSLISNAVDAAQFTQAAADKVWASATRTLTSVGTLVADVAAAVWTYVSRTLTQTAAQVIAVMTGTDIIAHRGDTIAISFTGLGNLTGRSKLWFTVKHYNADLDPASIIQIAETTGLLYLNGAPGTASEGSLVVTNATTGAVTVNLAATSAALLVPDLSCTYDLQLLAGSTVTTLTAGSFTVQSDQTRSTS